MKSYSQTIFITSFHGLVSRVLESGVLDYLLEKDDVRVVLFVPDFKIAYFESVFKGDRVKVYGITMKQASKISFFFHKIAFVLLHTQSMKLIRKSHRGYKHYWQYLVAQAVAGGLGRWGIVRALFREINSIFSGPLVYAEYFEKYKPDLVFSTDIKHVLDTQLLIEAKKLGIKTVGMVRSWDYLTAKGIVRVKPDTMIVHNEIIKEEAIRYADMKACDVVVVGLPHFDPYTNFPRSSREDFFKRIGVDPKKRLLFLAPFGDKFADVDRQFFRILSEGITEGRLPSDLNVLVRLPPGDTVDASSDSYPHLFFDAPGVRFDGKHRKANEMNLDDLRHLADSLHYSDVVLTGPSTIAIDAAALDRPTVFLVFDGNENYPYNVSVRHYYDFLHLQNVIRIGGIRLAKDPDDLFSHIHAYLGNPRLEHEERKRIVNEQCGLLDGDASKRLADVLLTLLS